MNSKGKGLISYLLGWIGGLLVLVAFDDNTKDDVMHAAQSIVMCGLYVILSFACLIFFFILPLIFFIPAVLYITFIVIGIINVLEEKDPRLPVVGDIAEAIFKESLKKASKRKKTPSDAKYDPYTGKPIKKDKEPMYDPYTGEKLKKDK